MALAIQAPIYQPPSILRKSPPRSLEMKVLAVSLAAIAFFAIQLQFSLLAAISITFVIGGSTFWAEKYCRNPAGRGVGEGGKNWFSTEFDQKRFTFISAFLVLRPILIKIFYSFLGLPLPSFPQKGIAEAIFTKPWRMIPIAAIIAPIAEEILFRGFLLERLEDAIDWLKRHISIDLPEKSAQVIQALIFGVLHLNRAIAAGFAIPVVVSISIAGYLFALCKGKNNDTLLPGILVHSANNTGSLIYLLMQRRQA